MSNLFVDICDLYPLLQFLLQNFSFEDRLAKLLVGGLAKPSPSATHAAAICQRRQFVGGSFRDAT